MKNVIFFVILAILTVAALVGWNAVRNQNQVAEIQEQRQEEVTPTPIIGSAVGRGSLGSLTVGESTESGMLGTKGNSDVNAGVIPTATPTSTVSAQLKGSSAIVNNNTPIQARNEIYYTETGFSPKTLTVKAGTMVKFVNQTTRKMSIASGDIAGGKKLDGFVMSMAVGKEGTFEFQFNQVGSWGYIDQNNPNQTGLVIVN
jgi:plastocyanin